MDQQNQPAPPTLKSPTPLSPADPDTNPDLKPQEDTPPMPDLSDFASTPEVTPAPTNLTPPPATLTSPSPDTPETISNPMTPIPQPAEELVSKSMPDFGGLSSTQAMPTMPEPTPSVPESAPLAMTPPDLTPPVLAPTEPVTTSPGENPVPATVAQTPPVVDTPTVKKNKTSPLVMVVAVIGIVGAISGIGWYFLYTSQSSTNAKVKANNVADANAVQTPAPTQEPTATPEPTPEPFIVPQLASALAFASVEALNIPIGWQTFTHPELNINLKYPTDWQLLSRTVKVDGSVASPTEYTLVNNGATIEDLDTFNRIQITQTLSSSKLATESAVINGNQVTYWHNQEEGATRLTYQIPLMGQKFALIDLIVPDENTWLDEAETYMTILGSLEVPIGSASASPL